MVIIGDSKKGGDNPSVTINPANCKFFFNHAAYKMMCEKSGFSSDYIFCMTEKDAKDTFWFKLCKSNDNGARRLNISNKTSKKSSRNMCLTPFFKNGNYKSKERGYYELTWDESNEAGKIVLDNQIETV